MSSETSSATWRAVRKKNSKKTPQSCRGWWNMRESFLSRWQKGRDGRTPFEILRWQEAYTRVWALRREGAGETNIFRTFEQNESQIQVRSAAGSEKQQCRVLRVNGTRCIQCARGQEDRTSRQVGERSRQQCDQSPVENG